MSEAALDAELSLPQYATMSDQQAADAIMAKTIGVTLTGTQTYRIYNTYTSATNSGLGIMGVGFERLAIATGIRIE